MNVDQSKQYYVDPDPNSYRSFFDHDWARQMFAEGDKANLSDAVFSLCEAWKGAANTAALPWLTVELAANSADGFFNHRQPYASEFLDALSVRVGGRVQPPLSPAQQQSLGREIGALNHELLAEMKQHPVHLNRRDMWDELCKHKEFCISLITSQRLAYAAVYYAYEDFLVTCYLLLSGAPDYRIGRSFPSDLTNIYGAQFTNNIWSHAEVTIPRLVRHAIAHNGARETSDLAKTGDTIGVIDGMLQITPTATRVAFNSLKDRATVILQQTANRMPGAPP
jgi:hypothetical protein